jgi:drug/metabolite transporter (DMT)-like permease
VVEEVVHSVEYRSLAVPPAEIDETPLADAERGDAGPLIGERVRLRQWVGLTVGLVGVVLVVSGDMRVKEQDPGESAAPLWAYALPFVAMAGLVAATLLERRMSLKTKLETPLDVALAIQYALSAVLFAIMAMF